MSDITGTTVKWVLFGIFSLNSGSITNEGFNSVRCHLGQMRSLKREVGKREECSGLWSNFCIIKSIAFSRAAK